MIVVYSPRYDIDIGTHVFPTRKYSLLHDRIRASGADVRVLAPSPAAWDDLALVHTPDYLRKARTGDFSLGEIAQLEVPWSEEVMEGFRLMTGGTIAAALGVVAPGGPRLAFHIGGGFHHAFADHGEGFCFFNDVAVAIRVAFARGTLTRAAVIDLDVHHGNGTAAIFHADPNVFTFSMHQEHNYPAFKPPGRLDVGVTDSAGDARYLQQLRASLPEVLAFAPEIVFYLAGADPYEDDQLGGLALTKAGLRERDRMVLAAVQGAGIPMVIVLAGGYARNVDDTVDIHYATFEEAMAVGRA